MIRVRLFFDALSPRLGSYASLPVKKCWMMVNLNTCKHVNDLEELIRGRFFDENVKLSLSIDDFVLPSDEVIEIIHENDIIRVQVIGDVENQDDQQSSCNGILNADNELSDKSERKKKKKKKDKESCSESEKAKNQDVKSSKHKRQKTALGEDTNENIRIDNKEHDCDVDKRTKKEKKKKHKKSEKYQGDLSVQGGDCKRTDNQLETSTKKTKDKKGKDGDSRSTDHRSKGSSESSSVSLKDTSKKKKTKSLQNTVMEKSTRDAHAKKNVQSKEVVNTPTESIGLTNGAVLSKPTTIGKPKAVEQNKQDRTSGKSLGQRLLEISQSSKVSLKSQPPAKKKGHIRFSSSDESSSDESSSETSSSSSSEDEVVKKSSRFSTVGRTHLIQNKALTQSKDSTLSTLSVGDQMHTSSNQKFVPDAVANHIGNKKDHTNSQQVDVHSNLSPNTTSNVAISSGKVSDIPTMNKEELLPRAIQAQQSGRGRKRRIGQTKNPFSKTAQLNTQLSNKSIMIQNPVGEPDKQCDTGPDTHTPDANYKTPDANYRTPNGNHETPDANLETPDANLETPDANHETADVNHQTTDDNHETSDANHQSPNANQETHVEPEPKDYTQYPPLIGPPRAGDKIAYKILELSNIYCPEVSHYKEAQVVSYNAESQMIEARLSSEHQLTTKRRGRFELHFDDEEDGKEKKENQHEPNDMVSMQLTSLIEPKLLS